MFLRDQHLGSVKSNKQAFSRFYLSPHGAAPTFISIFIIESYEICNKWNCLIKLDLKSVEPNKIRARCSAKNTELHTYVSTHIHIHIHVFIYMCTNVFYMVETKSVGRSVGRLICYIAIVSVLDFIFKFSTRKNPLETVYEIFNEINRTATQTNSQSPVVRTFHFSSFLVYVLIFFALFFITDINSCLTVKMTHIHIAVIRFLRHLEQCARSHFVQAKSKKTIIFRRTKAKKKMRANERKKIYVD